MTKLLLFEIKTMLMRLIKFIIIFLIISGLSTKLQAQKEEYTDDRDGQAYGVVEIGDQSWLSSNLNYETGNSVWYNNKKKFGKRHGRLYSWEEALTVCPSGWRLPSDKDWTNLINYLGGAKQAGEDLKASGTSGFDVFFSGFRDSTGTFFDLGHDANFWTSTSVGDYEAWRCYLDRGYSGVVQDYYSKSGGLSVRCIKDEKQPDSD